MAVVRSVAPESWQHPGVLYRYLLRPLLYRIDAERAHHLSFGALRGAAAIPGVEATMRRALLPRDEALQVQALGGLRFPTPIGLAAGFDKDALGFEALGALGFGHVEVGTLTGQPQPGNPKPRLFRLPKDRAIVNRMGFNNGGSEAAEARLRKPRRTLVGVNIGKTKVVPESEAIDDYVLSARRLAPHADYMVVNVSSPNTPGLRDLQAVSKLRPLLAAVREAIPTLLPLVVKIAPDLADEDVDAVADLALELGLDGIIATNTTIAREGLRSSEAEVDRCGNGGLSGAPLNARSVEVLRRLRRRTHGAVTLISVGGVETAAQAFERILAGASLVQVYTGFIYGGPLLPRRLALGVAALARDAGFARVQDAIGADFARPPGERVHA